MGFFSEIRSALKEIFAEFSQDVENRGDNPFFSLINRVTISPPKRNTHENFKAGLLGTSKGNGKQY